MITISITFCYVACGLYNLNLYVEKYDNQYTKITYICIYINILIQP